MRPQGQALEILSCSLCFSVMAICSDLLSIIPGSGHILRYVPKTGLPYPYSRNNPHATQPNGNRAAAAIKTSVGEMMARQGNGAACWLSGGGLSSLGLYTTSTVSFSTQTMIKDNTWRPKMNPVIDLVKGE